MALAKGPESVLQGSLLKMQRSRFSDWAAVARKAGRLRRVEEFPVLYRLGRLEDKMFLPVQSPPAVLARVPGYTELHAYMLLFVGAEGT